MVTHRMNILITGAESLQGRAVLRSLAGSSFNLHAASTLPAGPSTGRVERILCANDPESQPASYVDELLEYCARRRIDVIYPVTEASVSAFDRFRDDVPFCIGLALPSAKTLSAIRGMRGCEAEGGAPLARIGLLRLGGRFISAYQFHSMRNDLGVLVSAPLEARLLEETKKLFDEVELDGIGEACFSIDAPESPRLVGAVVCPGKSLPYALRIGVSYPKAHLEYVTQGRIVEGSAGYAFGRRFATLSEPDALNAFPLPLRA